MSMICKNLVRAAVAGATLLGVAGAAQAACTDVTRAAFTLAAKQATAETNGFGFGFPMWYTMVDESGVVCYVYSTDGTADNVGAKSGNTAWLLSRVISAQKANNANGLSLDDFAISSGFTYAAVVPGGSLYGLQHSNPVDASRAYLGAASAFGTATDPMVAKRIGGVNVFGGGVALYSSAGKKIGAVGASGDTSCRDHAAAYRLRVKLHRDYQPNDDGLTAVATPAALGEHPVCGVADPSTYAWSGAPLGATNGSDFGWR